MQMYAAFTAFLGAVKASRVRLFEYIRLCAATWECFRLTGDTKIGYNY